MEWIEYNFYVYIMFNERAKATYIGVTNNLERRVIEHKMGLVKGHTKEKGINKLGYYEQYQYVHDAIAREKLLKGWKRVWKYRLIESENPEWKDLAECMDDYIAKMPDMIEVVDDVTGLREIIPRKTQDGRF